MEVYLLTNEEFVKGVTGISDNISGKVLGVSMMEAQEVGLKGILGSNLLEKLKTDAAAHNLTGLYAECRAKAEFYLAYKAASELLPKVTYKVTNAGVVKNTDEHLQAVTEGEMNSRIEFFQAKADYYAYELQKWLLENATGIKELTNCEIGKIRSNLYSAASCGIWLGGERGKGLYPPIWEDYRGV